MNCNNSAFIINENVTVAQWHPNEFIEIEVISSGIESPILTINDRNIKDGKVEYSVYSPEENVEHKRIADRIPEELANVIKVIYIGIIIVLLVAHLASHPVDSGDPKFDKEVRRNSNWIVFIALIIASIPFLWMF